MSGCRATLTSRRQMSPVSCDPMRAKPGSRPTRSRAAALFLGWPLQAWARPDSGPGADFTVTHESWVAEHVWISVVWALLVILGVLALVRGCEVGSVSLGPLLAWPALTWATGADYTGYARTRAGLIAGAVWLGILAACRVGMLVMWVLDR
jgi:hypothetical protein